MAEFDYSKVSEEKLFLLYNNNEEFKGYVDRYSREFGLDISTVLKKAVVKEYYLYLVSTI